MWRAMWAPRVGWVVVGCAGGSSWLASGLGGLGAWCNKPASPAGVRIVAASHFYTLFHVLQCLMGGPSAGFAACINADEPGGGGCRGSGGSGEAASGSGKRLREEEITAAGGR